MNLYLLRNRLEKLVEGSLFYLFLKLIQIDFIFSENVRILYVDKEKISGSYVREVSNIKSISEW